MSAVLSPDEALSWMQAGPAPLAFSPLGDSKALCLQLADCEEEAALRLAAWLKTLVCPVIGIGAASAQLASACDVRLDEPGDAVPLLARIDANPVAATVLCQVLRVTEALSVPQALQLESLAYATLQGGAEYARWLEALDPQPEPEPDAGPAVLLERQSNALTLQLNRPSNRNAMSVEVRDALNEALQLVLADDSIASVEISGRGKCFSTGGDLAEFGTVPDAATGHIVRGLSLPGSLLAQCAERVTVHVHGACIGSGVEFPAFAGQVTASANAHFQLPELAMGLIPGAGGCISIARRMGRQRCAWLALSGKRIKADQALAWGLIDEITDQEMS